MSLIREARDPRGFVLGGIVGGLGWALGIPILAAAGIGAVAYGVKVFAGSLAAPTRQGTILPVRARSPEQNWLHRAEAAVESFGQLTTSIGPGPVRERAQEMGTRCTDLLDAVRRLAGQTSTVSTALGHMDTTHLAREAARLTQQLDAAPSEEIRAESQHSLDSVRAQQAVDGRLQKALQTLLARLESGVLGLEGLVARLVEVLAMAQASSTADEGTKQIDALADELEGLRSGLAETEDLSRNALSAFEYETQSRETQSRTKGGEDAEAS